ncbi:MAG: hypothetical protein KTR31_18575, partial [Myxococcales bacterium]|nr:hypothetical protein [Myxococcales bacterium]
GRVVPMTIATDFLEATPTWSPDGTRIAFTRIPIDGGDSRVWVMNANGHGSLWTSIPPETSRSMW